MSPSRVRIPPSPSVLYDVAVPRIREIRDDAGGAVLLDDVVGPRGLHDELELDVLVPGNDDEARSLRPDVLVLAQRQRDPLEARARRALADELVVVVAAEADRLLLDPLVHRPEEALVLREAPLAPVGGLSVVHAAKVASRGRDGDPAAGR